MMRPESIRRFDLFFLASLALLVVGYVVSFQAVADSIEAQTAAKGLHLGSGFAVGIFVVVLAIDLLLWFLVSRKGMAIAKWLLVLLLIIDLFGVPALVTGGITLPNGLSLLRIALEAVAIGFLFRADAKAWFAGAGAGDAGDAGGTA